jgi:hypothetical protein
VRCKLQEARERVVVGRAPRLRHGAISLRFLDHSINLSTAGFLYRQTCSIRGGEEGSKGRAHRLQHSRPFCSF